MNRTHAWALVALQLLLAPGLLAGQGDPKAAAASARTAAASAKTAAKAAAVARAKAVGRERAAAEAGDFRLYGRNGDMRVLVGAGEERLTYSAVGGVRPVMITFSYSPAPAPGSTEGFFELANNTRVTMPSPKAGSRDSVHALHKEVRFRAPQTWGSYPSFVQQLTVRATDARGREKILTLRTTVQRPAPPAPASVGAFDRFDNRSTGYTAKNAFLGMAVAWLVDKPYLTTQTLTRYGFDRVRPIGNGRGLEGYIAANDDMVLLAFRGTDPLHLASVLADVNTLPVWADVSRQPGVYVHAGFRNAFEQFRPHVRTFLDEERARGGAVPKRVFVVGHSLGGALATLAATWLTTQNDVTVQGVYLYGAPSVGSPGFRDVYNARLGARTFRIVNQEDPISRLPRYPAFAGVGQLRYIDHAAGHRVMTIADDMDPYVVNHYLWTIAGAVLTAFHPRHHTSEYFRHLEAAVPDAVLATLPEVEGP